MITLEKDFCIDALKKALSESTREIFNSDQGSQYTSDKFIEVLEEIDIDTSMDGRSRVFDIFIERLWRTVKYEEVYFHDYRSVRETREGLSDFFHFYNTERPHASLNGHTSFEVYYGVYTAPKAVYRHRV